MELTIRLSPNQAADLAKSLKILADPTAQRLRSLLIERLQGKGPQHG